MSSATPVAASTPAAVDVVLPVRADPAAAASCVAALLQARNRAPFDIIVVAFCAVANVIDGALAHVTRGRRVVVVRSARTDGDQAAIEEALSLHRDRDIVVMDPGVDVHGDWLDRLAAHARSEGVAVVCPFTNAGSSARYPWVEAPGDASGELPAGESVATLDARFASVNAGRSVDAKAAIGPCRYVTRAALASIGAPLAAQGDDEDVARDFVRRAADAGFRAVIAGDVFVAWRQAPAPAKHDSLDAPDAVALARRVDLARLAASRRPVIVFVAHGWGGGIRRHMDDLAHLVQDRADVLYLEPAAEGVVKLAWPRRGEGFTAFFALPAEMAALAHMLRAIGAARLHFHHVHRLPVSILDLPQAAAIPYDVTLHDYYAICPQYHLVDRHGRYCGEPDAAGCAACLGARPPQWPLDIGAWRARFDAFLRHAARVIAPSYDVETRIHRYFPGLPIVVWPHPEAATAMPSMIRVVTLGNLSREKGLRVVAECARDARRRGLPLAFRVLGAIAEPIPQSPEAPLTIHGSYVEGDLPALLAAERPDVLLFPAQVPETYAYTLSTALATDAAIVASALGAFTERLAGRARVRLLPFNAPAFAWNDAIVDVAREAPPRAAGATTRAVVAERS